MPSSSPFNVVGTLTEGKSLELEGLFGSPEQRFTQTAATLFGTINYKSTGETVALGSSFKLSEVVFTHNGSENADSALKLSSGGSNYSVGFRFERENDAPIVRSGDRIVIKQGQYYKLDSRLIKISDSDSPADKINISLAFADNGGYLVYVGGEFRDSRQFSYRELLDNKVVLYVQDLNKAGNINVQVDDGRDFGRGSIRVFHSEFATAKNILPTIAAGTKQPLTFIKGGSTLITLSDDQSIGSNWFKSNDNGALALDLKVKVLLSNVKNGYFTVDGKKTIDFTYQELKDGLVNFVHDGTSKKPSFQFKLVDAMGGMSTLFSSLNAIGEQKFSTYVEDKVTKDNHAPEFTGSTYFSVRPEAETIEISNFLSVSDPDGQKVTLSVFSNSLVGGNVSISETGRILYHAATQDFVGGDVIKILADDGLGGRTLQSINISYTGGVPKVTANDFFLVPGVNITLSLDMLNGIDTGNNPTPAHQLKIDILSKTANLTFFKDGLELIGSFTLQDVIDGRMSLALANNDTTPDFTFTITDSDQYSTAAIKANIEISDNLSSYAPKLTVKALDPDQNTNSLVFDDTYISVIDSDSPDADVTLTVTDNNAGTFRLSGKIVSSFTLAEAKAGKVTYTGKDTNDHFLTITATDKEGNSSSVDVGSYNLHTNMIDNHHWGLTSLNYYFSKDNEVLNNYPSPLDGYIPGNVASFTEIQKTNVRQFFLDLAKVVNVVFTEVNTLEESHFNLARTDHEYGLYGRVADFPAPADTAKDTPAGDVWMTTNAQTWSLESDNGDMTPGKFSWMVFQHEFGHALGLHHPWEDPTNPDMFHGFTVMSYLKASDANNAADYTSLSWKNYSMGDILSLQAYYGVNQSVQTNDVYSSAKILNAAQTIWDGGGIDLFDFHDVDNNSKIDLRDGHFSSINADGLLHFAIAYNTVIENVITGAGSDTIHGNGVGNNIATGKGDDTIYGHGGDDIINAGAGKDLIVTEGVFGSVDGGDGVDTLRLGDGRINLLDSAIVNVEILDLVNDKAQMISLSTDQLFSLTQIDGDAVDLIDGSGFRLLTVEGDYNVYQRLTDSDDTVRVHRDIVLV
ncbi:MAG: hypothetical protein RL095_3211 [Verrucomicrobiota bacterium]|jgi:hypothetical protein